MVTAGQVSQNAVADATTGHGQQLFLDRFDGATRCGATAHGVVDVECTEFETHGVDTGEPTDGPREIGTGCGVLFSPVTFHLDQCRCGVHASFATPTSDGERQSRQQTVVDAATECGRKFGQQCTSRRSIDAYLDVADGVDQVDGGIEARRSQVRILAVDD